MYLCRAYAFFSLKERMLNGWIVVSTLQNILMKATLYIDGGLSTTLRI